MSWAGLKYKGVEPIYPEEWNTLVDALDTLKSEVDSAYKKGELQFGVTEVTTDADGYATISFPQSFSSPPAVVAQVLAADMLCAVSEVTESGFTVRVYTISGGSMSPAAGATVKVMWLAVHKG